MSERRGFLVAVGSELVFFDDEPATEPAPATWRDADTLLVDGIEVQRFGSWTDARDASDALGGYSRSLFLSGFGSMRECVVEALRSLPNAAALCGWVA
jgi:hypothetical protein